MNTNNKQPANMLKLNLGISLGYDQCHVNLPTQNGTTHVFTEGIPNTFHHIFGYWYNEGFHPGPKKIDSGLPACSWTVVFYLVGELHVQAMINLVSRFRISWAVQLHSNRILILIMFLYENRSGMHVQISADLMSYLF